MPALLKLPAFRELLEGDRHLMWTCLEHAVGETAELDEKPDKALDEELDEDFRPFMAKRKKGNGTRTRLGRMLK